jgi:hypothetical protein
MPGPAEGCQWLEDLGGQGDGSDLQIEISALAVRLRHLPPTQPAMPRLQVRTRNDRWAVLHASWMNAPAEKLITVIAQEAAPAEVTPLIMTACGLTDREDDIRTGLPGHVDPPDRGPTEPDRRHRARST